jgi:hypothetical protein
MSSVFQKSPQYQRIVIHHLSDLHYPNRVDLLVRYNKYLDGLPTDRQPNLVVITGDLTASGDTHDLKSVADILRSNFARFENDLQHRIYVVPGPRDINWDSPDSVGLAPFYKAFGSFGLPSQTHEGLGSATTQWNTLNYIAYPIDTCYSLEDISAVRKDQFDQYSTKYQDFMSRYQRLGRRIFGRSDRTADLATVRDLYLQLTEANELTLLDAGRVHQKDLEAFKEWVDSSGKDQIAEGASREPLKILITHHPFAVHPEIQGTSKVHQQTNMLFQELARSARNARFHLALHGHIHKPQVLSDLSILEGPDVRHPMRQVGAGSLGDNGMFNEITAVYHDQRAQRQWRLEIRTINVSADNPDDASPLVLLNPAESASENVELLEREARRRQFDIRVRTLMRQFSEDVNRPQPVGTPTKSTPVLLPQYAIQNVERIIRDVVFPADFALRMRLLLKEVHYNTPVPKLSAAYLAPPQSEGFGPLNYPASVAAWSLVLGRTLIYPPVQDGTMNHEDYEWLRRSGKDQELIKILEALNTQAPAASYSGPLEARRYDDLLNKLKKISQGEEPALSLEDVYQKAPVGSPPTTYRDFICIPFPQRPGGVIPQVPEIGVLNVGVRVPQKPDEGRARPDADRATIFTEETISMLETLVELIGMILITSSALGKPPGVWDDRF